MILSTPQMLALENPHTQPTLNPCICIHLVAWFEPLIQLTEAVTQGRNMFRVARLQIYVITQVWMAFVVCGTNFV